MPNLKTTINNRIEKLAASERITKAELSALSRELLTYVMVQETHDIDAVNRTLAVLTPMNKRTAALFFVHFLPFSFDEDTCKFGGMNKRKVINKMGLIAEFLLDEANDIWSWAADNIKVEKKEVNYLEKISKDVEKAMDEDGQNASAKDVINAIIAGGLTAADMTAVIAALAEQAEEPEQQAA